MKKVYILQILLIAAITANAQRIMKVEKYDGTIVEYLTSDVKRVFFETQSEPEPPAMPIPEIVDLGLSVTWASWNLGATETTTQSGVTIGQVGQLGGYYSWGETSTKSRYRLADYLYGDSPLPETTLTAEHDAAVQNWGDGWRMPTEDEWDELVINCTVKWESVNGLQGYRYTSKKNGRSIFIPAGGVNNGSLLFSDYGYYWSSTKHPTDKQRATCMLFNNGQFNDPSTPYERFCGMPIRPVKKK